MKKILGLDLGTNSIGWAVVKEAETNEEKSDINGIGVRSIPMAPEEKDNIEKGKAFELNAARRMKRGARRNLQRYKLRRNCLVSMLKEQGWINDDTCLYENGKNTTFETYRIRSKAAVEEISLEELSRVLLAINKKRGYKSNRKAKGDEEGSLIDGMSIAKTLYSENLTPGEYTYRLLKQGKRYVPDFYPSDLKAEFIKVWNKQKEFHPELLSDELLKKLEGKNEKQTWAICAEPWGLVGVKREGKRDEQTIENYQWRVKALTEKMELEQFVIVLQQINKQISGSSGYLGNIGDRSKVLHFNHQTVGQYQMAQLDINRHNSLRNEVFYRQDYLDEFEQIWETQAKYHPELTTDLKRDIRDVIIFYQRPLKSQKALVGFCEFESRQKEVTIDGKKKTITIGMKCCPKSSPLFQDFKTWQVINNIVVRQSGKSRDITEEEARALAKELSIKDRLSKAEAIKLLFGSAKDVDINYKSIEGNRTMASLFRAYQSVVEMSGHGEHNFAKMGYDDIMQLLETTFNELHIDTGILHFNALAEGKAIEQEPVFKLWHLLYSYSGDKSATGDEGLVTKLMDWFGFEEDYAKVVAKVNFDSDFGNLSAKAIRKILPHLHDGLRYDVACEYAGYRHSKNSLTKEEIENKVLQDRIEPIRHNSLRNPVVEKVLNQMVNVVNSLIDRYGKFDEIRVEMARELKKSRQEREEMSTAIAANTRDNDAIRKILQEDFHLTYISRNDILRYRLYRELEATGYKTLYSQTYIPKEKLFSKEFDIEHIIPQAKLFDDSFSNKTLEARDVNINKADRTAFDYVCDTYDEEYAGRYQTRIEELFKNGKISKTKRNKLLMKDADIPSGFIERDLRNTQYIARKAMSLLGSVVRVVTPTIGSITDTLREDWQLVNIMQELNWNKYDKLGLTEYSQDRDGRQIGRITDWTKRNDQRHHAMDALTIAFTRPAFIQYLNNKNARSDKAGSIYGIECSHLHRDLGGKLRFNPPMPLDEFRAKAKAHLESILVSYKAKNKVVTRHTVKAKGQSEPKVYLTPRGQLHNETIYGLKHRQVIKFEPVNGKFNAEKIATVARKLYREALLKRLAEFGGDPKKAFTGSNAPAKKPIYADEYHTIIVPEKVKTITLEEFFTKRTPITPDLKIDKVVDARVRAILEQRLSDFGGDIKGAFSNLDKNPIWLNKEKGIDIKSVIIDSESKPIPIHSVRDRSGKVIVDSEGNSRPTDYVSPNNNHHIAIYRDNEGNLQEQVVTFIEAVTRTSMGFPAVDKEYNKEKGWNFQFTMRINDYFVFPDPKSGFNPKEIDLLDQTNAKIISKHLFRIQQLSSKYYVFRHHLETSIDYKKELAHTTWKRITSMANLEDVVKVRINNIGEIVQVGEY